MDKIDYIDLLRNEALERCKQRVEEAKKNGKPKILYGVTSGMKGKWGL